MSLITEKWNKWLSEQEDFGSGEEIVARHRSNVPKHIVDRLKRYFLTGYGRTYFVRWFYNNHGGGGVLTQREALNIYENGCRRSPCIAGDRPEDYGLQDHIMDVLDSVRISSGRGTNKFTPSEGDASAPGGAAWSAGSGMRFGFIQLDGDPAKNPKKYARIITKLLLDAVNYAVPFSSFCRTHACPETFTDIIKPAIDSIVGGEGVRDVAQTEMEVKPGEPEKLLRNELSYLFVRHEDFARSIFIASTARSTRSPEEVSENVKKAKKYLNLIKTFGNTKLSPWYAPQLRGALMQAEKDNKADEEVINVLGNLAGTDLPDDSIGGVA